MIDNGDNDANDDDYHDEWSMVLTMMINGGDDDDDLPVEWWKSGMSLMMMVPPIMIPMILMVFTVDNSDIERTVIISMNVLLIDVLIWGILFCLISLQILMVP